MSPANEQGKRMSQITPGQLMNGSKILLECLVREGVDCIFGYPGGVTLPLYDALYDHPIRHVLVRHEEDAAFAAQGYARSPGQARRLDPEAQQVVGVVDADAWPFERISYAGPA